jgi:hypothetical protein
MTYATRNDIPALRGTPTLDGLHRIYRLDADTNIRNAVAAADRDNFRIGDIFYFCQMMGNSQNIVTYSDPFQMQGFNTLTVGTGFKTLMFIGWGDGTGNIPSGSPLFMRMSAV